MSPVPGPPALSPAMHPRGDNADLAAGTLTPSWGALTRLRELRLFDNQLTGPLPGSWSGMAALEVMQIANNSLTGGLINP